jgi:coenzyme F420 hydrogenase subunit beta
VPFEELTNAFLDGKQKDALIGQFDACYLGHAVDPEIRHRSASGGLVTALLAHALQNGQINGALLLGMSDEHPLRTRHLLATTVSEVVAASGSKYCPAAVNEGLREILAREGRFAVVGLPCHIHGVRKMEQMVPRLRDKIGLHLGLFCANTNSYLGTEYFLWQNGIAPDQVCDIRYRGEGWPGKIVVTLLDGRRIAIPRGTSEPRWDRRALFSSAFHYDFILPRCLLCPDHTCELADIACADPWMQEYLSSERSGKSMVIVRTSVGARMLADASEAGVVEMQPAPLSLVHRAQNYAFKAGVGDRIHIRQLFSRSVPDYGDRPLSHSVIGMGASLRYLPAYVSHRRWLWPLLCGMAMGLIALQRNLARVGLLGRLAIRTLRVLGRGFSEGRRTRAKVCWPERGSPRILLVGARLCRNLGGPSLLVATRVVLARHLPEAAYLLMVPAESAHEDQALQSVYGIQCLPYQADPRLVLAALFRLAGITWGAQSLHDTLSALRGADVVVDIWGIAFADSLGANTFLGRALPTLHLLLAKAMGKPVIKYTADYGPIEARWNRLFAKLYFGRCSDLILARDENSQEALDGLGIRTPVMVCPDTAFLLEGRATPTADELREIGSRRPVVGLSVSFQMHRRYQGAQGYVALMASLADGIISKTGAMVVIIPNELSDGPDDDQSVARAVFARLVDSSSARVLEGAWSAPDLKGVIQTCDVVVASRYHTLVAALSSGIPSLAIGWHHKYRGLLEPLGQERFVCEMSCLSMGDLQAKFDDLWRNRQEIAAVIRDRLPAIQEAVLFGAQRVRELMATRSVRSR